MSPFVYPGLLWMGAIPALLLVGIPILIHLINMMRHRRVQWGAMEFLLISQKKNRTWVLLKQLLLLLMRMLAIATVIFLVAQPKLYNQFGEWFGTSKTHHVVLLDDSFSMSDRWGNTSAFDEAKTVVQRIGSEAASQATPQTFTLLRFSRAAQGERGTQPDLYEEKVDMEFAKRIKEVVDPLVTSQAASEPILALEAVSRLLGETEEDRRTVYLISDFRGRQWGDPADLKQRLEQLEERGVTLHLINCVESARANTAITGLAPAPGTRAAGTRMYMEVTVKNFGETLLKNVPIAVEQDGKPKHAVTIPEIPPGEAVTKQFQVHFDTSGYHQIATRLKPDPVAIDNHRYVAFHLPIGLPVLLIDGNPKAPDARFLALALESDAKVRTGINPRIEQPRFLSLNPLDEFHVIYLMNIDRLDQSGIEALEKYIDGGGGVAMFLGPRSRSKFINDKLYRDGKGFFPAPLAGPAVLRVDHLEKAPDFEVVDEKHPMFKVFTGQKFNFASMLIFEQYFAVPKAWSPPVDSTVKVIAQLRNRAPLAIERSFGKGRVIAFLSTAGPTWNNWAKEGPTFPITMLQMQAYLATQPAGSLSRQVGTPLEQELDPEAYRREVDFIAPSVGADPTANLGDKADAEVTAEAVPRDTDGVLVVSQPETDTSGIYKVCLNRKDGTPEQRLFAFNVDAQEGNLATVSGADLLAALDPVEFEYSAARQFQYNVEEDGYNLFEVLLYFLILLLIGEQILAWSASYHPPTRQPLRGKGGVR